MKRAVFALAAILAIALAYAIVTYPLPPRVKVKSGGVLQNRVLDVCRLENMTGFEIANFLGFTPTVPKGYRVSKCVVKGGVAKVYCDGVLIAEGKNGSPEKVYSVVRGYPAIVLNGVRVYRVLPRYYIFKRGGVFYVVKNGSLDFVRALINNPTTFNYMVPVEIVKEYRFESASSFYRSLKSVLGRYPLPPAEFEGANLTDVYVRVGKVTSMDLTYVKVKRSVARGKGFTEYSINERFIYIFLREWPCNVSGGVKVENRSVIAKIKGFCISVESPMLGPKELRNFAKLIA